MAFSVFPMLDQALVASETSAPYASKSPAVWPSEASALRIDKTLWNLVGKCSRSAYYRMMGFQATRPIDPEGAWKFLLGREIEKHVTTQTIDSGLYVANGVKHFVADIILSLEFDVVVLDPTDKRGWIVECKSYFGYKKKSLIETKHQPALENLIQICLYILEAQNGKRLKQIIQKSLEDRTKLDEKQARLLAQNIPFSHRNRSEADLEMMAQMDDGPIGGKLVYVSNEAKRTEFTIEIFRDFDGSHYPMVDGVPYKIFSMESVYARYKTIQGYWFRARGEAAERLAHRGIFPPPTLKLILCPQDVDEQDLLVERTATEAAAESVYLRTLEEEVRQLPATFLPPAEYEFAYTPEKIDLLAQHGEIGKINYGKWKKGQIATMGDWQCTFCSYAGHCMKACRPELTYTIEDIQALLLDPTSEVEIG